MANMKFDIHKFDNVEFDENDEQEFYEYLDELLELFFNSSQGEALLEKNNQAGFWAAQMIDYGYNYIGVTIPQMEIGHIHELLRDLFPRKISLESPEDARETIPELIAFWEFLQREFELPNAVPILAHLRNLDVEEFVSNMNDSAYFGMAKSFFMQGQQAGFDMTDEKQFNEFAALYNLAQTDELEKLPIPGMEETPQKKRKSAKLKQKRKQSKADRKRNRKKKRKK